MTVASLESDARARQAAEPALRAAADAAAADARQARADNDRLQSQLLQLRRAEADLRAAAAAAHLSIAPGAVGGATQQSLSAEAAVAKGEDHQAMDTLRLQVAALEAQGEVQRARVAEKQAQVAAAAQRLREQDQAMAEQRAQAEEARAQAAAAELQLSERDRAMAEQRAQLEEGRLQLAAAGQRLEEQGRAQLWLHCH